MTEPIQLTLPMRFTQEDDPARVWPEAAGELAQALGVKILVTRADELLPVEEYALYRRHPAGGDFFCTRAYAIAR